MRPFTLGDEIHVWCTVPYSVARTRQRCENYIINTMPSPAIRIKADVWKSFLLSLTSDEADWNLKGHCHSKMSAISYAPKIINNVCCGWCEPQLIDSVAWMHMEHHVKGILMPYLYFGRGALLRFAASGLNHFGGHMMKLPGRKIVAH